MVRTIGSHPINMGSTPVGDAILGKLLRLALTDGEQYKNCKQYAGNSRRGRIGAANAEIKLTTCAACLPWRWKAVCKLIPRYKPHGKW